MDLKSKASNRAASILAFGLLGQGIVYSPAPLLLISFSSATIILFLLSRGEYRDKLPFLLIAAGPLINFAAYRRSPYIYNIEVVLLTYLGLWFSCYNKKCSNPLTRTSMWYIGFVALVFLSTVVHMLSGDDPLSQIRLIRGFALGFLLFWFLQFLGDRLTSLLPIFFKTTLFAFAAIVGLGLSEYVIRVISGETWFAEPSSVFDGSESLAIYLVAMLPLVFGFASLTKSRVLNIASKVTAATGLIALFATHSRAGLVAALVYVSGSLWAQGRRNRGFVEIAVVLVLVATLFSITLVKSGMFHMESSTDLACFPCMLFSSRVTPWREGFSAVHSSPLWGNGAYENVYNVFLQVGAQFGAVAALVFIIFLVNTVRASLRNRLRGLALPMGSSIFWSLTAFLIISMGESTMGNQLGYFSWMIVHLSIISPGRTQRAVLRSAPCLD